MKYLNYNNYIRFRLTRTPTGTVTQMQIRIFRFWFFSLWANVGFTLELREHDSDTYLANPKHIYNPGGGSVELWQTGTIDIEARLAEQAREYVQAIQEHYSSVGKINFCI